MLPSGESASSVATLLRREGALPSSGVEVQEELTPSQPRPKDPPADVVRMSAWRAGEASEARFSEHVAVRPGCLAGGRGEGWPSPEQEARGGSASPAEISAEG